MSKNLSELLGLLVEEAHGDIAKVVFATLVRKGRLTLHAIIEDSELSANHVRQGLAVLTRNHLVYHHTDRNNFTFYEADRVSAYTLVRTGRAATAVAERYGEDASKITATIAEGGFLSIGTLRHTGPTDGQLDASTSQHARANGIEREPHVNGGTNGDSTSTTGDGSAIELHNDIAIHKLLRFEYITPLTRRQFMSRDDLHIEAEQELQRQGRYIGGPKGLKAKAEYATDLHLLKRKWADDEDEVEQVVSKKQNTGHRSANGVNGHTSLSLESRNEPNDDMIVQLNQEKVTMIIRTERLVDLAARYVSHTASQVYEGLLFALEEMLSRCYDEFKATLSEDEELLSEAKISASADAILDKLHPELDLSDDLPPEYHAEIDDDMEVTDGQDLDGGASRQKRLQYLNCHLQILCGDTRGLAHQVRTNKGNRWKVRFRQLSEYLIQQEIEDTTTARWGSKAKRLLRVLHRKGRLEDRQIAEFAIMKIKEVRLLLRAMQEKNFVGIQEVPKDNARHPSRTIFLWFYDQDRVRRTLLDETYMCMSRLLQRRQVEQAAVQPLLDKLRLVNDGDDVSKIFNRGAIVALQSWEFKEEKLLLQLTRQDDTVAILRDFLPEHI